MAKGDKENITGLFRRQWPEYQVFVSSVLEERGRMRVKKRKKGYWATVITMIHKSCGEGQKCKIRGTASPETGRVMSVKITQEDGREVVITNVYQHVASRLKEQDEIWREVKRRVVETGKDGILHIIGEDMNASLFPDRRQGYAVGEYQRKADQGFRELVCDGEISGGWVVGRVEEEGITRVDGKAGKRARIDEILISDGRRLSQIAKGNLNTAFMEYALHTSHTGQGNRYDHLTVLADIPSTLLQREYTKSNSQEKEIIDKKSLDEGLDEWRKELLEVAATTSFKGTSFEDLQQWIEVMRKASPTKTIRKGGINRKGRRQFCSKQQGLVGKQIKT